MAQKLDYPKTEEDFRKLQDDIYRLTKEALANGNLPSFKGLLEIISSETVILTAIHKIKANKGSRTPGSDGETMRKNILEKDYLEIISRVQDAFKDYKPQPVRRVFIPKPGKTEKRPLGIPAIIDRIVQECVKLVIEPILEAQFFKHSYGFRPMREPQMALRRTVDLIHRNGYHWIIEGDISKFFDNVNHSILIKKLWHMGIRDRRVLMIIKAMLKAGIMDELKENPLGTPQGGIISPLLANAYLDTFDQWIAGEWEEKKTRHSYKQTQAKYYALKKNSNLIPAYLIRYADDWVLVTSSRENAEKWKYRIEKFLHNKLSLTLSKDKTKITNIRKRPIHFLGFTYKVVKGKGKTGYITRTKPDPDRLRTKVDEIRRNIKKLKRFKPGTKTGKIRLIDGINQVNYMIRGVIQYYEEATWVSNSMNKYAHTLKYTAYKALKPHNGKWVYANQVDNLTALHSKYKSQLPTIKYNDKIIAVTDLAFCNWRETKGKTQEETPYSQKGRELYQKRSRKKPLIARADELLNLATSAIIKWSKPGYEKYNFEYFLSRPYAFNRDKGKCRVCGINLDVYNVHIHHKQPKLPMESVNRVNNLISLCASCHSRVHNTDDLVSVDDKTKKKILRFREKLDKIA